MDRPMRLEFPGGLYHVMARGNERRTILESAEDCTLFLDVLAHVQSRYRWLLHAYCLMPSHYHLLVETPEGNLVSPPDVN